MGVISPAQFVDLNVKVGGADINAEPTQERGVADEPALLNAHRSGAINTASNLDQVAIIDLRGSDDGAFHDAYRAFSVRARLDREHGTHANQVIWQGPAPLFGETGYPDAGLLAMDRWLAAVEKDDRNVPLAQKIRDDRPADVIDKCTDGNGNTVVEGTDCPAIVRVYETPRMVAGESIVTDTNKCALKPLAREDYEGVTFTDEQWSALEAAFPTGVCDWTKRGVSAVDTIPWLTYEGVVGGRPLGGEPHSTRFGCLARRSRVGRRRVGRVRLGLTKPRLLRRVARPGKQGRLRWTWCVRRSQRTVTAVFNGRGRVRAIVVKRTGKRRIVLRR